MSAGATSYTTGLLSKDLPTELDRLRLLERSYDPGTRRIIEGLPLAGDSRCLELGAGAGSIAGWLATRFPGGTVTAADIDPRYLDPGAAANLVVRDADLTRDDFPAGTFDLVHARAVFMHLPNRAEVLRRAVRWLAPGGWLVIEDVYFLPAEHSPYPAWRAVQSAWLRALAAQDIDLSWARRVPAEMSAAGVTDIAVAVSPGGLGADPVQDELLRIRLRQSGARLVADGLVSAEELDRAAALLDDNPAPDLSTFVYSTWGRRPIGERYPTT